MLDNMHKNAERSVFLISIAICALAFAEGIAQLLGFSLTARTYSAGRMLEFSAMLFVLVAVLNLRQIRKELANKK